MKKRMLVTGFCAVTVLLSLMMTGCMDFKKPEIVVREPGMPGESTITYTPPPEPKFPAAMITDNLSMIRQMMNKEVKKVTEDIYVAMGYALGQVVMIITEDGLVIIDTSDSEEAAKEILADFRKITDKPIRYIIYTHFHPDHTQGSPVFYKPGVKVVATEAFSYWLDYQNNLLGKHHKRSRATQSGRSDQEYTFKLPVERNPFRWTDNPRVILPTKFFKESHAFTLGGKRFELIHTKGETEDHLAVFMPDERILFPGDLYYASFPNLSTPMLESRPVTGWIESLTKFIDLKPNILVPQHTLFIEGAETVREHLTNYRDAVKYVHDETVRCINQGKTVHQAVAEIKLPDHLASKPYLQEKYGRVDWSIRGIYHGYKGWYDGKGTGLYPLSPEFAAREMITLAGGADKVLARAIELQKNSEHQLCAELCDIVIAANPKDRLAHRIKAVSMHFLAYSRTNLNSFGFYRSAHAMHMKAAE